MARRELDFYKTHQGLTRKLLETVSISGKTLECCAGDGAIANIIPTNLVWTNDINPNHNCDYSLDATKPESWQQFPKVDWVITNPPFSNALGILDLAYQHADVGVAFLLRLSFIEPAGVRAGYRNEWLKAHKQNFSNLIVFGNPRPSFTNEGSDFATVAWMVWRKNHSGRLDYEPVDDWKK
ncbi:MAG TPA: hypothetical protein VK203_19645 [Nostocaceae cyanobacterium]|nr:hypothetical protein [Nostocaceae cyanobacterium]